MGTSKKISSLTQNPTLTGLEEKPVEIGGVNYKQSLNDEKEFFQNNLTFLKNGDNVSELTNDAGYLTSETPAPVDSVNGKTGVVVLDKSDVGLGSADNTADIDKEVSTPQQIVFDSKANEAGLTQSGGNITGTINTETNTFSLTGTGGLSDSPLRTNFFRNNEYQTSIRVATGTDPITLGVEEWFMGTNADSFSLDDSIERFGYNGKMLTFNFSPSLNNFWFQIPAKSFIYDKEFINDRIVNVNLEFYSPVTGSININPYAVHEGTHTLIETNVISVNVGINTVALSFVVSETFDVVDEGLLNIRFFSVNEWDNETVNFGRCQFFSGAATSINLFSDKWNEQFGARYADRYLDENEDLRRNLLDNYNHSRPYEVKAFNDLSGFNTNMTVEQGVPNSWASDLIISDSFDRFGYRGNMITMPILSSTTSNFLLFQIPIKKIDNSKNFPVDGKLTFNLELQASEACSLNVQVYKIKSDPFSFFALGSSTVVLDGVNSSIGSVTVDADNTFDSCLLYIQTDDNSHYNKTLYIGRANFFDGEGDTKLEFANDMSLGQSTETDTAPFDYMAASPYQGQTAVFLGDSITAQGLYQPEVQRGLGLLSYVSLGVGGSMITPYITGVAGQMAGDSIYFRADSVAAEDADIIFLAGGQNDNLTSMGGDIDLGTINDTPYSGVEVSSSPPTFYASYMGTLEKLIAQNLDKVIHLITPFWSGDQTQVIKQSKVTAIIEIGNLYGVTVTDLLSNSGINTLNNGTYLVDIVHPNPLGGERCGRVIANNLK